MNSKTFLITEYRIARLALFLPKLKPRRAKQVEMTLDRIYRNLNSIQTGAGKELEGSDEDIDQLEAELEAKRLLDDQLITELEKEVGHLEVALNAKVNSKTVAEFEAEAKAEQEAKANAEAKAEQEANINKIQLKYKSEMNSDTPNDVTGESREIIRLSYLIWYLDTIVNKYDNVCAPIALSENLLNNMLLYDEYSLILYSDNQFKTYSINSKPYFKKLKECFKGEKKFIISVLIFINGWEEGNPGHANFILFNTEDKIVYHFDPYGEPEFPARKKGVISNLVKKLTTDKYTVLSGIEWCPYSFQDLEEYEIPGNPGNCFFWVIWILKYILESKESDIKIIIQKAYAEIKQQPKLIAKFIQDYAISIDKFTRKRIKELGFDLDIGNEIIEGEIINISDKNKKILEKSIIKKILEKHIKEQLEKRIYL